jgi:hypothetical protein
MARASRIDATGITIPASPFVTRRHAKAPAKRATGRAMTVIEYNQNKMAFNAIGCAALAIGGAVAALMPDWPMKLRFVGGFLAVCLPFVSLFLVLRIKSGSAALAFDSQGVSISTFYRTRHCRWSDVRDIKRETLTQSSGFGLVKQDIGHYIVITFADGVVLEELRVQEELLACPKQDVQGIVDAMAGQWMAALNGARSGQRVMPVANPMMTEPLINGAPLPRPSAPGFGRKGL